MLTKYQHLLTEEKILFQFLPLKPNCQANNQFKAIIPQKEAKIYQYQQLVKQINYHQINQGNYHSLNK